MKQHPVIPSTLRDRAKELVNRTINHTDKNQKASVAKIARDTGLSESWVRMFANNEINNPDVGRVQKLYEYCSGELLKV